MGINTVSGVALQAQTQQQAPFPYLVAVVDVAQLIKVHPIFLDGQTKLQSEVNQAEATFKQRQQTIAAKQKNLEGAQVKAGTPEHQRLLDEIANDLAEFEKDAKTHQRKFALENSKIMFETYKNIKAAISRYGTSKGIAQVTDYRQFEPDPSNPQTVAEDMDQRLVWFSDRLNITQQIIAEIYTQYPDRKPPVPGAPSAVAVAPAGGAATTPRTAAATTTAAPAGAAPAYGTQMQQR